MKYVLWYLLLSIPCFFAAYCNSAGLNSRLKSIDNKDGFLKYYKNFFSEGFCLLIHDYFGVYCPFSWARARRYRLADMKVFLGEHGRCHDRLGHITAVDCDDPQRQESIAQHTFISRTRFWTKGIFNFLIAPIPGSFVIIDVAISGVAALGQSLVTKKV